MAPATWDVVITCSSSIRSINENAHNPSTETASDEILGDCDETLGFEVNVLSDDDEDNVAVGHNRDDGKFPANDDLSYIQKGEKKDADSESDIGPSFEKWMIHLDEQKKSPQHQQKKQQRLSSQQRSNGAQMAREDTDKPQKSPDKTADNMYRERRLLPPITFRISGPRYPDNSSVAPKSEPSPHAPERIYNEKANAYTSSLRWSKSGSKANSVISERKESEDDSPSDEEQQEEKKGYGKATSSGLSSSLEDGDLSSGYMDLDSETERQIVENYHGQCLSSISDSFSIHSCTSAESLGESPIVTSKGVQHQEALSTMSKTSSEGSSKKRRKQRKGKQRKHDQRQQKKLSCHPSDLGTPPRPEGKNSLRGVDFIEITPNKHQRAVTPDDDDDDEDHNELNLNIVKQGEDKPTMQAVQMSSFQTDKMKGTVPRSHISRALSEIVIQDGIIESLEDELENTKSVALQRERSLKNELAKQKQILNDTTEEVANEMNKRITTEKKLREEEREKVKLRTKCSTLEGKVKSLTMTLGKVRNETERKLCEVKQMYEGEVATLKDSLEAAEKDGKSSKHKNIDDLETKKALDYENDVVVMQNEILRLLADNGELVEELQEQKEAQEKYCEMEQEVTALREQLEEAERETLESKNSGDIEIVPTKLSSVNNDVFEMQNEIMRLNVELTEELQQSHTLTDRLESEIRELQSEIATYKRSNPSQMKNNKRVSWNSQVEVYEICLDSEKSSNEICKAEKNEGRGQEMMICDDNVDNESDTNSNENDVVVMQAIHLDADRSIDQTRFPQKADAGDQEELMHLKNSNKALYAEINTLKSDRLEMEKNAAEMRAKIEDKLNQSVENENSLRRSIEEVSARLECAENAAKIIQLNAEKEVKILKTLETAVRSELLRVDNRLKSHRAKVERSEIESFGFSPVYAIESYLMNFS